MHFPYRLLMQDFTLNKRKRLCLPTAHRQSALYPSNSFLGKMARCLRTVLNKTLLLAYLVCGSGIACAETPPPIADSAPVSCTPILGDRINRQLMGENLCALTFDDGPGPWTEHLLDQLDEFGIPATFFILGRNAEHYPDTIKRALAEGHQVESHSYSHPNLKKASSKRRLNELTKTNEILRSLGGDPMYLRPPYGEKDKGLIEMAASMGLRVITWSRDSEDWKKLPADYAMLPDNRGNFTPRGQLRGIFLFHDIHKTTVNDLPRIVKQLRDGGCQRFVTVHDYLNMFFCDPQPPLLMTRRKPVTPPQDDAPFWTMSDFSQGWEDFGEQERPLYIKPAVTAWSGLIMDKGVVLEKPAALERVWNDVASAAPHTIFKTGSEAPLSETAPPFICLPVLPQTTEESP